MKTKLNLIAIALLAPVLSFAVDLQLPAALTCKTTTCFVGSCGENTLTFSGLDQQKITDAKYNDQDWDTYLKLIPTDVDAELVEPAKMNIDFYEDGHGFFLTTFYVRALEELVKGEKSVVSGTFQEGTEWGSNDVESSGVIECSVPVEPKSSTEKN